jgi:hypothetical protein
VGDNQLIFAGTSAGGSDGVGLVFLAPVGTPLPTSTTAALDAAFVNAGMISEDGVTFKPDRSTKEVKAAGSNQVQLAIVTDEKTTFEFSFLEVNPYSMAVYAGKSLLSITPDVTGEMATSYGGTVPQRVAMVVHAVYGNNISRLCAGEIDVSGRKERKIGVPEADQRGVTCTAYPDTTGVSVYEYAKMEALAA